VKPAWLPWCHRDPQRWETLQLVDGIYRRAPRGDVEAAVNACRACPLLDKCRTHKPAANTVLAGVIYGSDLERYTTVAAYFRATVAVPLDICGTSAGTPYGYRLHRQGGEQPCDPCREARNAAKRAQERRHRPTRKPAKCQQGHPYTDASTRLDAVGQRFCGVCRPGAIVPIAKHPNRQKKCKAAGHDWTDPRNVTLNPNGRRRCLPCHQEADARRGPKAKAVRAARRAAGQPSRNACTNWHRYDRFGAARAANGDHLCVVCLDARKGPRAPEPSDAARRDKPATPPTAHGIAS
jgi:hypothetical protein